MYCLSIYSPFYLSFCLLHTSISLFIPSYHPFSQSFFGFGPAAEIDIELADAKSRDVVTVKDERGEPTQMYLFTGGENIAGTVRIRLPKGKKLEHLGICVELIGEIGTSPRSS